MIWRAQAPNPRVWTAAWNALHQDFKPRGHPVCEPGGLLLKGSPEPPPRRVRPGRLVKETADTPWECALYELALEGDFRFGTPRVSGETTEAFLARAAELASQGRNHYQLMYLRDQERCRAKWRGRYPPDTVVSPPAQDQEPSGRP